MRRLSFKTLLLAAAACLSAAALPSCATNDSMMFIIGVYARKQGACSAKPDIASPILAKGIFDVQFATDYRAALLVGNQITARGSRERLRTETSRVTLKGAEVRLETPQGASLASAFSATGTGFVDSSDGTDPALAIMYASLIPNSVVASLPIGTLIAKVRVFGTTLGGQDVESGELGFPIEVCNGCLVSFPASSRDIAADGNAYQCKIAASDTAATTTSTDVDQPCDLGIDLPVDCTVCSSLYDACLAPAKNCYYNPTDKTCALP